MSNAVPVLEARGLVKTFSDAGRDVDVLRGVDLHVAKGDRIAIIGSSGSGKTTLLQLICGLVEASEGRVVIDGRDQSSTPVHQRDIGLVFQHYALFPHLTVAENIAFPLKMRGRPGAEIAKRVAAALEMVHLGHLSARFPRELSGGQQQRVALARCFVYQPSIILMDEPLGALDKKLSEHMQIEIKRLHRESVATIVYVTHDQEEALAMSDRICLMNHARIEQLGTPREIYERPRTAFAADFIGISNIFRGRWDGNGSLDTAHGRFALPRGARCPSQDAALVIRPENLRLGAQDGNAVNGRVSEVVYAGSETRVIAALDEGGQLVLRLGPDDPVPAIDEAIVAGWARDKAVLVA